MNSVLAERSTALPTGSEQRYRTAARATSTTLYFESLLGGVALDASGLSVDSDAHVTFLWLPSALHA
ncbi:hypothetical protein CBG03_09010, partial [Streptococcus pyogenes]